MRKTLASLQTILLTQIVLFGGATLSVGVGSRMFMGAHLRIKETSLCSVIGCKALGRAAMIEQSLVGATPCKSAARHVSLQVAGHTHSCNMCCCLTDCVYAFQC